MAGLLTQKQIDTFRKKAASHPHPREMVIEVLRAIQDNYGWVPDEGVVLAASVLGLTATQVEEVAAFSDKIYRRPVGKLVIRVCDSVCCRSRGGEAIMKAVSEKLGITPGETTADGIFTLIPICCLGACGSAPSMRVGETLYSRLAPEQVGGILDDERARATG